MPDEKPKRARKPKDAASVEKPMRPGPRGGALQTGPKPKNPPKVIPNAPQEGQPGHAGGNWLSRPGHNGGGKLKTGNTVGVGRKPAEVRASMLDTLDKATHVVESILDGEFKVEIRDMVGQVVGYRAANIKEFVTAWKALADHALPTRQEVSGPNGAPIAVENAASGMDALLDSMSPEDYEAYKAIVERANAARESQ